MDKKELKFYEAPACDVVELKFQGTLLSGSTSDPSTNPFHDNTEETPEEY